MKPVITEKAVMLIESQNVLTFHVYNSMNKSEIKKQIEDLFEVKVSSVRTLVKGNKKYAYVKLNKDFLAIDVATKLGLI